MIAKLGRWIEDVFVVGLVVFLVTVDLMCWALSSVARMHRRRQAKRKAARVAKLIDSWIKEDEQDLEKARRVWREVREGLTNNGVYFD